LEKTQLLWQGRPDAIGLMLLAGMERLIVKGGIAATEVPRRIVSKKGGVQHVSLLDVNTLEPTYSRDAGSLVPPSSRLRSLSAEIKKRLDELLQDGRLTDEQFQEIRTCWLTFESAYLDALKDFAVRGLHTDAVLNQAEAFGRLLNT